MYELQGLDLQLDPIHSVKTKQNSLSKPSLHFLCTAVNASDSLASNTKKDLQKEKH